MSDSLSILIHADSKAGKSTLGSTCPQPVLLLDAEGSTKFLPVLKTSWDPLQGPPPAYDGTWTHCVVVIRDFNTILMAYQWLVSYPHHFRSIVLDSISELQRQLKTALVGTEAMQMQAWGELLTKMDNLIRGYRDLTLHPTNPLAVVMFIAETRESKAGKWIPYMQGQISISLPYWMDIVGHLRVATVMAADGQTTTQQRQLLIGPDPLYETGERVQGRLPHLIAEPNIWTMYLTVFPHLNTNPS